MRLARFPLLERLGSAEHVLLAGAGGGYDVYCAVPLYTALREAGVRVSLASLTFTYLGGTDATFLAPGLARVTAETTGEDRYFPERRLCEWLSSRGDPAPVYCFEKTGVAPLRAAYRHLVASIGVDAVVLVDGGTDILLRGDEAGLGTPEEDATSLAAVAGLEGLAQRHVACVGFGVDAFHGVSHAQWLERAAALAKDGAFLGVASLVREMPEAAAYLELVDFAHAAMPARPSIVNASIASAVEGAFGDAHRTERTKGSELFVSPLMSIYWAFDLDAVARASLYLPLLEGTQTIFDVGARIEGFRRTVQVRPRTGIPG